MRRLRWTFSGSAVLAFAAVVVHAAPASATIVVTDLGVPPDHHLSQANSVTDDGAAVGYALRPSGGRTAVRWAGDGTITELETPGRNSEAHDVNGSGVIVGAAEPTGIERPYPAVWDATGARTELRGGPGSARGVNDAGVIVGGGDSDGLYPLRWDATGTAATRLATLTGGERDSFAFDINNAGVIVGYSTGTDRERHGVRWDAAGAITQLDTLPGYPECYANQVNDSGMIIGTCFGDNDRRAVRWDDTGAVAALPATGFAYTDAHGLSDAGIIVGDARGTDGRHYAVRWGAYGAVTRLATLGGVHGVAVGINDTGTVVGRTNLPNGDFHATSWRNAG